MTIRLADFQDCFAQAVMVEHADAATPLLALAAQPGFAVYRNTIMKGCIDTLQANFPAVLRLVGEPWLRAAASLYVRRHPPQDNRMLVYGDDFPDFLATIESAAGLPYLPGVARLDRMWNEAHAAPDQPPLEPATLAAIAPDALGATILRPHRAARWRWFADQPVHTIWKRNRSQLDDSSDIRWHGEGALLVRPHAAVADLALGAAGCAFLDACQAGRPLAQAAAAAVSTHAGVDIALLLSTLIQAGALAEPDHRPVTLHQPEHRS